MERRYWHDVWWALGLWLVLVAPALAALAFQSVLGGRIDGTQAWFVVGASVMCAALTVRRRYPGTSAAVVLGLGVLHLWLGRIMWLPFDLVTAASAYALGRYARRRVMVTVIAALGGLVLLTTAFDLVVRGTAWLGHWDAAFGPEYVGRASWGEPAATLLAILTLVAALAFGWLGQARADRRQALEARQEAVAANAATATELAVAAERTRIAREMHDIVAHSLSVVIAQADGGRYAAASDPEAAVRSLAVIAETGRAALADMRRILGVLRDPGSAHQPAADGAPAVPQPRQPLPDGRDVGTLVDTMREAGLDVSYVRVGTTPPLPLGLGLALYRVAQEALTNALKHGGPGVRVTVLDQCAEGALTLEVTDDGRGAAAAMTSDGKGHGLVGMRERVEMFGGTLQAGPAPGGGFRVRAVIPLPGSSAPAAGSRG